MDSVRRSTGRRESRGRTVEGILGGAWGGSARRRETLGKDTEGGRHWEEYRTEEH